MEPLDGLLVVDLTRYLPGPFASRELLRLGARVVRLEAPDGDPLRHIAPGWNEALNAGKESVVCDLKRDPAFALELCSRADVVLESFRPGVLERLGLGADRLPPRVVLASITGFGADGPHVARAGHDLNYLGWAGVLEDTAPGLPPVPVADLAAGALSVVNEILAALLARERTGRGGHVIVSMTHGSHRLVAHELDDPRPLTGRLACYRIYATADGRRLTVAALEAKFFIRLCELIGRPELAGRQFDPDQEALAAELASVFASRPLGEWLELADGEDVCVGPVATLAEGAASFGEPRAESRAPTLGEHTESWRRTLGLAA